MFENLLQKIALKEFQEFILEYATKNKNFKTEFEIRFADKDDRIDVNKKYSDCEIAADRCFLLYLFHLHHPSSTSHSFCLPHLIVLYFLIVLSPLLFFAITVTLIPPPYLNLSLSIYLSIALPSSYHYYLSTSTLSHLGKHSLIVTAPDFILPACVVPLRGLHVPQD